MRVAYDFFRDQGSIIAGLLALFAALLTIRAIRKSADREIAAAQQQTEVAQKQLCTSLQIERRRLAHEELAFYVTLQATTTVVLEDVNAAREILPAPEQGSESPEAYQARQQIRKTSFADLRSAYLKLGSELTEPFLRLDNEIDDFASQWRPARRPDGPVFRIGLHAKFHEQLDRIKVQATDLQKAACDKRKKLPQVLAALDGEAKYSKPGQGKDWSRRNHANI
jgi:hypothetical protein